MGIENADTRMKRLARRIDVQLSDHAVSGEAYALHPDDWAIIRAAIPTRILGDRHE
jgi:hypothetical protein